MSADKNEKSSSGLSEKALAFSVDSLLGRGLSVERQSISCAIPQQLEQNILVPQEKRIQMKLCKRELWCKFHHYGNEMILTKTGRRIFPPLQVEIFNLHPECYYIIWVEILPIDSHRYKYVFTSSQWMIAGKCDPPFANNRYCHPDGVATGKHWMSRPVALDKLKLTNNKHPVQKDQMTLRSMHKYQPKIHVQLVDGPGSQKTVMMDAHLAETFTFPETSFITVTAYQNQEFALYDKQGNQSMIRINSFQITRLKIECNRFAKGFRERTTNRNAIQTNRQERENTCNFSLSAFTPIIPNPSIHPTGCWYEPFTNRQALEPVTYANTSCLPSLRCLPHCCTNDLCGINFYHQYAEEDQIAVNLLPTIHHRTRNKLNYHPYLLRTL